MSSFLSASKFSYVSVLNFLLSAKDRQRNAFGAKIEVPSKLKINKWRSNLTDYDDKVICDFLQYGWPINYTSVREPDIPIRNHSSSLQHKTAVDDYLSTEQAQGATQGHFDPNVKLFQLPIHSVPLMTVPKKGSKDKQRVVLDFSYPQGSSINDGIPKDSYLDEPFHLRLPGSQTFIDLINLFGPGCLLFKTDLRKAYRQIPVDPQDYRYLAFGWRSKLYFDTVFPFGLRPVTMACQRTTNAVCFIHLNEYGHIAINYIDDFGAATLPDQAQDAFSKLKELLTELGLEDSPDKESKPTTHMIFLGLIYDITALTVSVPDDKLNEISSLVDIWLSKSTAAITELQLLVGKLSYVCSCIHSSWPHIYATFIKCFVIKLSFHIVRSYERITSGLTLVVYFSETLQRNFIITPTFLGYRSIRLFG